VNRVNRAAVTDNALGGFTCAMTHHDVEPTVTLVDGRHSGTSCVTRAMFLEMSPQRLLELGA